MTRASFLAVASLALLNHAMAFNSSPLQSTRTPTLLSMSESDAPPRSAVISADDSDFDFDPGQGGVRLASELALCMSGKVAGSKGNKATPSSFTRYNKLTEIEEAQITEILSKQSAELVAVGDGKELYKDPGDGTDQLIELAPLQAAKDLVGTIQSSGKKMNDGMEYILNVIGGDDMQVLELLAALQQARNGLGLSSKGKMTFNSLTHPTFPLERVTMTLIAIPSDASTNSYRESEEKAIAEGRIFFQDGNYYSLLEDDVNPDLI